MSAPGDPRAVRSVGVIGGGTAGYFAALALRARFLELAVTVIESPQVPIIGVGEATTPLMPAFLHDVLQIAPHRLFTEAGATFKLGIEFLWGKKPFSYPFGPTRPLEAMAQEGSLEHQSVTAMLMRAGKAPLLRGPDGTLVSLLSQLKFAYHLDNAPFVGLLAKEAAARGIEHRRVNVEAVVSSDGEHIAHLRDDAGQTHAFDLYVDASGFRSLLLSALGSPFHSYASSLFCDRALVTSVPQHDGHIGPYTTAETMDAGWCWRIPVHGEDHRGYVYASAFLSDDEAAHELAQKNPGLAPPKLVRFRSGRHADFWRGNVVALGNAYGFVEPLESTALHMVILEIGYLLGGLSDPSTREASNARVGAHWDALRWFLALHYKFNERLDTPFWRAARADVDASGMDALIDRFRSEGPWAATKAELFPPHDPAFGLVNGALLLMLGQEVPAPAPAPRESPRAWQARVARDEATVRYALPQAEALSLLRAQPELFSELTSLTSWLTEEAQLLRR